jgi:hypothetical protein
MPSKTEIMRSATGFIATALSKADEGQTWRAEPDFDSSWSTKLIGPDGQALLLDFGYGDDYPRIEIKGLYPSDHDGSLLSHESHKISVGRSRTPDAIAREITRRFLPGYRATMTDLRARIERNAQSDADRSGVAVDLVNISGGSLHNSAPGERPTVRVDLPEGFAEFLVSSPDSITLEVKYSTPDLMRKLAQVLREYTA